MKIARQISHPNVCRVYDVGEVDGHHYLSMEYVDGEDLASLLRRIGRLPKDKAVQISRQLCMGLAAAHEQGILHRDLKPANVMIDGRGRARITDFGLATLAGTMRADEVGAGTPLYMAPEQRAGKDVTVRSDLYSLGLVLYELFTGQRAFNAATPGEAARRQEATTPTSPSQPRRGVRSRRGARHPALPGEGAGRPTSSALAVAAALPGGDPLAAAVAAGETPSPDLVAEAGEAGGLRPAVAVACVAGVVAGVVLVIALSARTQLSRIVPLPKPPEVLVDRAHEIIRALGISASSTDSAHGFDFVKDYGDHLREHAPVAAFWQRLGEGSPSVIDFWYRQSPRDLLPYERANLDYSDPPFLVPGMVGVRLEPDGRLKRLDVVPAGHDESKGPWPEPQWALLFREAGLDPASFEPVEPSWSPPVYTDSRAAWESSAQGRPAQTRVEAAGVSRHTGLLPDHRPVDPVGRIGSRARESQLPGSCESLPTVMFFVRPDRGTLLARRNLRLGRSDRRAAAIVAIFVLAAGLLAWALETHHVASADETELVIHGLSLVVLVACACWLFYLAIEPYVRRLWPHALVSWVRLLDGRFRDPLVGRDVLFGLLAGVGMQLLTAGVAPGLPMVRDRGAGARRDGADLSRAPETGRSCASLSRTSSAFRSPCSLSPPDTSSRFSCFAPFSGSSGWRSERSSSSGPTSRRAPTRTWLLPSRRLLNLVFLIVFLRFGFLTLLVANCVQGLLLLYPMTFDFTRWYAPNTMSRPDRPRRAHRLRVSGRARGPTGSWRRGSRALKKTGRYSLHSITGAEPCAGIWVGSLREPAGSP